jgi:phytoene dehydrogenase-like protein
VKTSTTYDSIVIGAGLSGLAAALRMGLMGKSVLLLESHSIPGGMNSYFYKDGHYFDVGLHALTNFSKKGERRTPLGRVLKQLRIPYDFLDLVEQNFSQVQFPQETLKFSNNPAMIIEEIRRKFPEDLDAFVKLKEEIDNFDMSLKPGVYISSKKYLKSLFKSPLLTEMIMAPLLAYGSSWENDMELSQFKIMFQSIFCQGFSRPQKGVKPLLDHLVQKIQDLGGVVQFKTPVRKIITTNGRAKGVVDTRGNEYLATNIYSTVGLPETNSLCNNSFKDETPDGQLSFCEGMYLFDEAPPEVSPGIIFYNKYDEYHYERPCDLADHRSSIICFPEGFGENYKLSQTTHIKVTSMANFDLWRKAPKNQYYEEKEKLIQAQLDLITSLRPNLKNKMIYNDLFTPRTITKYTRRNAGAVYGSPIKKRDGLTDYKNLYLAGTDQGYLGIIGSMLSGVIMANTIEGNLS